MPKMNGIQVLEIIRDYEEIKNKKKQIIIISAREEQDQIYMALKLEAIDFITKPFYDDEIIRKLKECSKRLENRL